MSDDATDTPAAGPVDNPPVLNRLTRAQVFARDPEETTQEDIDFIVAELRKINERNRRAAAMTLPLPRAQPRSRRPTP